LREEVISLFQELADLAPPAREAYYASRKVPVDLRNEVESLLRFDRSAESLTDHIAEAAGEILQANEYASNQSMWGPYRVIRPLGRGGMGAVYLAERTDGEVEQRVAIKVVRSSADLPAFHERFLRERRILASLNHPGIARLLDANHTADGQPYLVMEFIDGVAIDAYCAQFDLRGILKLFLAVCEAVSYAHRNLIIHRDLKPSNILVDSAGRPKLLDFGIAKILDASEDARTMVRILTPEYASPEQMRGEAHSTATDIYSLGVVLQKLLAGDGQKSSGTMERTRRSISSSPTDKTPAPPSAMKPDIPRDIGFVVRKALRAEPEERYATVDAFAEDLRAFLENRPVHARAGNAWYRARKFVRRYWVPVTAGAVAVIGLSTGLYLANRERSIAEQRFLQVRQLANKVFDIDVAIRNTPGTTKARQLIVSTSLEYLQKVGAEARGDKDLALEIGSAYVQLAHVQGVPINSNLGQFAAADESLQKAGELVESVLKSDPRNRKALFTSATIAHDRMVLNNTQGKREEALAQTVRAAEEMDRLTALGHLDSNEVKDVSFMYGNVAITFADYHRLDDAIRYSRRSIEVAQSMQGTGGQQSLAYGIMADTLRQSGQLESALTAIRESRRLQEQQTETDTTPQRVNLALALLREGSILGEDQDISLNRPQDAAAVFRQALDIADELAKKDSDDNGHYELASEVGRRLGDVLRYTDPESALSVYDACIRSVREARNKNVANRREEARLLAGSSFVLRALHRESDGKERVDEAFALLRETGDYPASKIELASEADVALRALAENYAAAGQPAKAADTYRDLLAKVNELNPDPENDLRNAVYMSNAYEALARVLRLDRRAQEAANWEAERRKLWEHWDSKLASNPFVQRQLALARVN
jgi:tRNA A-37 threonylcarbamoyl transferase component Bud32/tetratricopeptide (TPR) repeat protein